jgi:hypothetical protein
MPLRRSWSDVFAAIALAAPLFLAPPLPAVPPLLLGVLHPSSLPPPSLPLRAKGQGLTLVHFSA